jgi:hypothetical protein
MPVSVSLAVEILLSLLLAATLVYCALLERKLTALRKGQDGLKDVIAELNGSIETAGTSMRMLKSAASGAVETLDAKVTTARGLIDELSLLTASGERIASRIERGGEQMPKSSAVGVLPAAASRLENARPRILRPEPPRAGGLAKALGGVR